MFKETHILLLFRHFIGKILRAKEIEFMATERRDSLGKNVMKLAQSIIFHFDALHGRLNRLRGVVRDAKLLFAYRENNWTIFGRYIAQVLISSSLSFSFGNSHVFEETFLETPVPVRFERFQLESFKRATLIF